MLTKNKGGDEYVLTEYFNRIKYNKFAVLIKLADCIHNVEDPYNMKTDKAHKYIDKTGKWIYPLCNYGRAN